jgi:hypothetical protein
MDCIWRASDSHPSDILLTKGSDISKCLGCGREADPAAVRQELPTALFALAWHIELQIMLAWYSETETV